MATTVTSTVPEFFKYSYGSDEVAYQFNEETVTWALLSENKKRIDGRGQDLMPFTTQNPGAFGGIVEGGALLTSLNPDTVEASWDLQEYVATYDVSWKLIQDAARSQSAFQRAIEYMDDGLKRRVFQNLNSDLLDNGKGRLAVLPAADNTSPITVAAVPRVQVGQVVDIMDVSDDDTKLADSVTVTGVDLINKTITTSGNPSGTAAGDYFVIQDTTDDSISDSLHSFGLECAIDDANPATIVGNFGNINRSTAGNEFWQASVLDNSGTARPLTEDLLINAQDNARLKGNGTIDVWMTNLPITRRYHEMLRGDTFFQVSGPEPMSGGTGRKTVKPGKKGKTPYQFSGVDWIVEPYANANLIYGLNLSSLFLGHGANEVPRPISEIFNVDFFTATANASFQVRWYYQMQLLSDNPAANVKLEDIAES